MVDVSGVGPTRPVSAKADRSVRDAAGKRVASAVPFEERAPSRVVSLAAKLAAEPPVIDHAKVKALRAAIANGTLPIESMKIANLLLGTGE